MFCWYSFHNQITLGGRNITYDRFSVSFIYLNTVLCVFFLYPERVSKIWKKKVCTLRILNKRFIEKQKLLTKNQKRKYSMETLRGFAPPHSSLCKRRAQKRVEVNASVIYSYAEHTTHVFAVVDFDFFVFVVSIVLKEIRSLILYK
jgi:hypothetical protein